MKLNEIADNPGAHRPRKRVGRGIGSGLGKTAGRGHKGQKSRSGVSLAGFEGGQMSLTRRLPKRGFNNISRKSFAEVNLARLQTAVDAGRLDAGAPVTPEALVGAGVVRRVRDGIRLLGQGAVTAKLTVRVHGASKAAIAGIEAAGGTVEIIAARKAEPAKAEDAAAGAE